ncbi:hypothetical protein [Clostridium grantii]|uniref:Putative ABC-transporter type IV n=1 Tax=Clostridium grantii DSM 8605 TaxID=1121316 RepID=A0A1M5QD54_9CLOT|nr:hypothetical protein [Clostridium grantii]SHH12075.1 Putative ABC-transporter type IV [Clostridium grantii DSM 8605]
MNNAFIITMFLLGVLELIMGFYMDKITKVTYAKRNIKNINSLIKWEQNFAYSIGILIILFAMINLIDSNSVILKYYVPILFIVFIVSRFGKKKYI